MTTAAMDRRAVLFVKDDFGGRGLIVDHAIRKLSRLDMDDKPSSIRIPSGAWQACVDNGFNGRCEIVDRSVHAAAAGTAESDIEGAGDGVKRGDGRGGAIISHLHAEGR
jgi:hypothetical protein